MTKTFFNTTQNGQDGCIKIGTYQYETRIQFQLKSGQSIRLAKTKAELLADPTGGSNGGIEITAAMGIVEVWWVGDLWVLSDSNGAVATYFPQGCSGLQASGVT